MEEKDMSPATGELTCCLRAKFAGTYDWRVVSANGLFVDDLWALTSGVMCEDANFFIERYQKINNQPN